MPRNSIKMDGYERIQSADQINNQAAMNLVYDVLKTAYEDYTSALRLVKRMNKLKKENGSLTEKEKKRLSEAKETIKECEEFYKSDTFKAYTLGKSIPGKEVIKKIKCRVSV